MSSALSLSDDLRLLLGHTTWWILHQIKQRNQRCWYPSVRKILPLWVSNCEKLLQCGKVWSMQIIHYWARRLFDITRSLIRFTSPWYDVCSINKYLWAYCAFYVGGVFYSSLGYHETGKIIGDGYLPSPCAMDVVVFYAYRLTADQRTLGVFEYCRESIVDHVRNHVMSTFLQVTVAILIWRSVTMINMKPRIISRFILHIHVYMYRADLSGFYIIHFKQTKTGNRRKKAQL